MTAALKITDAGNGRFMVEKRGEVVDIFKSADALIELSKSGDYSSARITLALQELADVVAKQAGTFDRESAAQRFTNAYGRGDRSRIPRSSEIMGELSRISALEKVMSRVDPYSGRVVKALPPASDGFRFTIDTLTGPPKVTPRRMDDTPRVLGPEDDGHLPTFAEVAAQIAQGNPGMYLGRDGKPNSRALDRANATPAGQDALERERQRNLRVNAPP